MIESAFFQDLAMMMSVAGVVSVVFGRLRWPKVLGYIFAGILLNQYTWGGSLLVDGRSVITLGQLGAVFLMFSLGLEFSTRDMKRLKNVTFPAAIVDTVVMTWLGYTVGTKLLGWGVVPSLFLGAAICDSATTMLAKVIGEMNWSGKSFVKYAVGTSVCEDMITVGIIAVITGVAVGNGLSLSAAAISLGGLFVFLLAVIVFGFILVPRLLKSVARSKDDEMLILTILGVLFFVSYIAYRFDFSLSLGAFLVGILGASSDVRYRIAELASPLKGMFAAVFFVSIGLLVDPGVCLDHAGMIIGISALVIVGKFLNCTLTSIACGERVGTSVQIGMSLAQIGEFAFLVAMIFMELVDDATCPIYQVVVAVSLLTTLLNPFMIRWSAPAAAFVERHVPAKLDRFLETYRATLEKYRSAGEASREHAAAHGAMIKLAVIAALTFAFATGCVVMTKCDYSRFSEFFERYDELAFFIVSNLFSLIMVPMVVKYARALGDNIAMVIVGGEEGGWQASIAGLIRLSVTGAVIIGYFLEVAMLNVSITPGDALTRGVVLALMTAVAVFGWRFLVKAGHRATVRFTEALGAEERAAKLRKMMTISVPEGVMQSLALDLASPAIGGNVVSLNIRAKTGASIVAIDRGGERIRNPGPDVEFCAGDILVAVGNGQQIAALKDLLGIITQEEVNGQ